MTNITPTTPPPEGCIDTHVIGHVLLIGINRPAKRNGWTPPMFRQLAEAYLRIIFLALDHQHPQGSPLITGNDGKPLARNPLHDLRVRKRWLLLLRRLWSQKCAFRGGA